VAAAKQVQPHLSVGQVQGKEEMGRLIQELQAAWTSVSFQVDQVSLIWRGEPPDDVFRVGATILLGGEPK
jgi:2'-5' RNA ligase